MAGSVIVAGARTPIGKLSGVLSSLKAVDLGGVAIAEALRRAGISPDQVDHVLMGHVLQAGTQHMTARQAATRAGIPLSTPANTINKVCLSGLNTIYLADLMINAGDADIVVAGGMESMSQAPHMLLGARNGFRLGDAPLVDALMYDGLTCSFEGLGMGEATEKYNKAMSISRERQDAMAAASHAKAAAAIASGRFAQEIAPVSIPQRKGDPIIVNTDEGVRIESTFEALSRLRPAFDKEGSITAGNASQISDGASAVIMMSKAKAAELGLEVLGELLGYGQVAGPDTPSLLTQPSRALAAACVRAGVSPSDLDIIEINEAFATVGLASIDDLGLDESKVNVNGGAIALGHPLGSSGNRIALTALYELKLRGGGVAGVGLCGGGGQGDAAIFRSL
jgi:acetyl-CoA C-acetyltransferase